MTVRAIRPEERIALSRIQTIAFQGKTDYTALATDPEKAQRNWERGRAYFDEAGHMTAGMELIDYTVRYHGHEVGMGGIAGVASLPESRRGGHIRAIFQYVFEELRGRGAVFSYLYPFSNEYYRQFGYEVGFWRTLYTLPMAQLAALPREGSMRMCEPGLDTAPFRRLYEDFIMDKNLAVVRRPDAGEGSWRWTQLFETDPYQEARYTYLYYAPDGTPAGYMALNIVKHQERENDVALEELVWKDERALVSLLAHLYTFRAQFARVLVPLTDDTPLQLLFPEPYGVKIERMCSGMNRIIDLAEALRLFPFYEGAPEGRLVLEATDAFAPWNQGRFAIEWRGESVEVTPATQSPDLCADIQALSLLLTGAASLKELYLRRAVQLNAQSQLLERLFVHRPVFLRNFF